MVAVSGMLTISELLQWIPPPLTSVAKSHTKAYDSAIISLAEFDSNAELSILLYSTIPNNRKHSKTSSHAMLWTQALFERRISIRSATKGLLSYHTSSTIIPYTYLTIIFLVIVHSSLIYECHLYIPFVTCFINITRNVIVSRI